MHMQAFSLPKVLRRGPIALPVRLPVAYKLSLQAPVAILRTDRRSASDCFDACGAVYGTLCVGTQTFSGLNVKHIGKSRKNFFFDSSQ